jgi:hypothetical protein
MEKITWKTFEHIHTEKTSDWYWIVGIVTVSLAVISIILNNIIFAVLIVVASFTLTLHASKKPNVIDIVLGTNGVLVGKILYPYSNLDSFWVETRDIHPRLIIKSKKVFMPFISILLEDADPDQVHDHLIKYLKPEEHIEPLFEKVLIYLGF